MNYLDVVYAQEGQFRYVLTYEKVLNFMFYQFQREQKRRGGGQNRRVAGYFNEPEYRSVTSTYTTWISAAQSGQVDATSLDNMPKPTNPIGYQALVQYKAAIKNVHTLQILNSANN